MIISVCYCENDIKVGSEYHNNIPVLHMFKVPILLCDHARGNYKCLDYWLNIKWASVD